MADRKNGLTYADFGRRYRCRQSSGRSHQADGPRHCAPRRRRRNRRLWRAVRPQGRGLQGPGSGRRHRRRRHQGQDRDRHRPARRHRHRPRGDVGQRPRGAGRRTAVLPRLFCLRPARPRSDRRDRRRRRRRLPRIRLRPDRRRDRGNAGALQGRRLRPGGLCGRRGRARHVAAAGRYRAPAMP